MSDTDELRAVLADATALPGDVRVRGTATRSVRTRARQRRATALGSGAAAAVVCVVVGLLALTGGDGGGRTAVPAAVTPTGTPTPSALALPEVAPGPLTLASPLEISPVVAELPDCPRSYPARFTLAAVGPSCYRLDDPWLVVHRLAGVDVGLSTVPSGVTADGRATLVVTLVPRDRATFGERTSANVGKRVAMVAGGRVWSAPVVSTPIHGGELGLDLPVAQIRSLLDVLGIPYD